LLLLSPQDFARRPNGSHVVISTRFFYVECGCVDYGYGLMIDGCGCVDLWTIWIWFDFLMLWIKPCCECGCVDCGLWTMDYLNMVWFFWCCESNHVMSVGVWTCGLWTIWIWFIFWCCECRGVLIVDLCFEYGVFTCVLNFGFYVNT
jgi:hypothetical protein